MVKTEFKTSYGKKIIFMKNYNELVRMKNNSKENFKVKPIKNFLYKVKKKIISVLIPPNDFLSDVFVYSTLIEFIESLGIKMKFKSSHDIGGLEGYISRILSIEGISENCSYSDIEKLSLNQKTLNYKTLIYLVLIKVIKIFDKNSLLGKYPNMFGYYPSNKNKFFNIKVRTFPKVPVFENQDFLKINKSYDLITSLRSLDHFDFKKIFKKVSDSMNENGIFAFLVCYWWWPVNNTLFIGNFPYAQQRLSSKDFKKYVEMFHKSEKKEILKRYNYFHRGFQPTLDDYIKEAKKNGLDLLNYKRLMPIEKNGPRTGLPPIELEQFKDFSYNNILEEIKSFKNGVSLVDLKTAYLICVFQKKKKK